MQLLLSPAVLWLCDMQGSSVLEQLVKQAAGRISIMAGGGVRSANAAALLQGTGVRELHSSAKRWVDLVLQCIVLPTPFG
jgi:copper homeostasis protein